MTTIKYDFNYVSSQIRCDSKTGLLFWKKWDHGRYADLTRPAGGYNEGKGYLTLKLKGKHFMTHRVVWLLSTGNWPKDQIDHINGNKKDNRLINLREATNAENKRNNKAARRDNQLGVLGVYWKKENGKYQAQIRKNGKLIHLGYFSDIKEARKARIKAENIYFGDFSPSNSKI